MKPRKSKTTRPNPLRGPAQAGGIVTRVLCLVTVGLMLGFPPGAVAAEKPTDEAAAKPVSIDPKTATLAEAITDFGEAVQKGDLKRAQRWTRDPKELAEYWEYVRAQHKKFGYETWIKHARQLEIRPGDVEGAPKKASNRFTIGGHDYDHLHIVWEKREGGWRISSLITCK